MKRAQRTDLIREMKKSFNRYISILLIMALGVAFYVGVRSAEPDMQLSAKEYFDSTNYMDIRVMGTLGMTEEDVAAIRAIEGVELAEGGYQTELFLEAGQRDYQMSVYSLGETVNQVYVTEGRLPEKAEECFLDIDFMTGHGYSVGDEIILRTDEDTEISELLHTDTFTIAGAGTFPSYLSWQRGAVSIGTGVEDGFLFLPKEAFSGEVFTVVYATAEDAEKYNPYTEEYEEYITGVVERIEAIADARCEIRFDEVTSPYWEDIHEAEAELADGEAELAEAEEELEAAIEELTAAEQELEEKEKEIEEGEAAMLALGMAPEVVEAQLAEAKQQLEAAKAEIKTGWQEADSARAELEEAGLDIEEGKKKLEDSRTELEDIERPEWYVLDRNTVQQFVEYGSNSERIGNLGDVFPAVFYLVAALVSLTTMTRMIEEERTQIGTMKALGYGKGAIVSKYMWYSLSATLLGGILGISVGSYLFPWVIMKAYGILYTNLPYMVLPIQWDLSLISVLIAVVCTVAATLSSCYREMMAAPAVLMRPVAPAAGKRVFLEYVTPVWNHLSFSWKATCRNLFRYKKRFFMTIFGIGGCMALLLVGFGLRDSIMEIVNKQYKEVWTYDAYLSINEETVSVAEKKHGAKVENQMFVLTKSLDVESQEAVKSATLFVPERLEGLDSFVKLQDRVNGEPYTLTGEGVIITEKLAKLLDVSVGETIELSLDDVTKYPLQIRAIAENYMFHYIYMSAEHYRALFGEEPEFNQLYLQLSELTEEEKKSFSGEMLSDDAVDAVTYVEELQESVSVMMQSLELVVVVLIVAAGMLAFIVLYNLNNINIIERRRELATLKVLGFYDMEVGTYVYRENVLLTILGILAGVVMGIFLHRFVILTVEVDMMMFGRDIEWKSYLYSVLLTCVFAVFINFGMFFKLRKIDMVESLKSAE